MMHPPFIVAIDFLKYPSNTGGIPVDVLDRLRHVFIKVCPETFAAARHFIREKSHLKVYADVSLLPHEDVMALQETGAAYLFITLEQLEPLAYDSLLIFKDRVSLLLPRELHTYSHDSDGQVAQDYRRSIAAAMRYGNKGGLPGVCFVDFEKSELPYLDWFYFPEFFQVPAEWDESYFYMAANRGHVIIDVKQLCVGVGEEPGKVSIVQMILNSMESCYDVSPELPQLAPNDLQSMRDSKTFLYKTFIYDEEGAELGQCFSTAKTLAKSLRTGKVVLEMSRRTGDGTIVFADRHETSQRLVLGDSQKLLQVECEAWAAEDNWLRFVIGTA